MTENIRFVPEHEINILLSRQGRSWVDIGMLLDKVEDTKSWEGETSSFSEWLRSLSKMLGVVEAGVWRSYTAFRFYKSLTTKYTELTFPKIEELHLVTNPDSLELLARLERVMAKEAFTHLTQTALLRKISRAKLRKLWDEYRPLLEGKTARGKTEDIAVAEAKRVRYFGSDFEENLFLLLQEEPTSLTGVGVKNPEISLFRDVTIAMHTVMDFIAVVTPTGSDPEDTVFHGIAVKTNERPVPTHGEHEESESLEEYSGCFEYLWIATDPASVDYCIKSNDKEIGVLTILENKIRICRAARRIKSADSGNVAKAVLKASLRK